MRFSLVDTIVEIEPGKQIQATKALSIAEEYLADHFPRFPVMPGVLMLESLFQASAWLSRVTDGFRYSTVWLKDARNVKYADFVKPGETLTVQSELIKEDGPEVTFKAKATVEGRVAVMARLTIVRGNLSDDRPELEALDARMRAESRDLFALLDRTSGRTSGGAVASVPTSAA